jgi:hypothetical protein
MERRTHALMRASVAQTLLSVPAVPQATTNYGEVDPSVASAPPLIIAKKKGQLDWLRERKSPIMKAQR